MEKEPKIDAERLEDVAMLVVCIMYSDMHLTAVQALDIFCKLNNKEYHPNTMSEILSIVRRYVNTGELD